jgi:glutamate---cysteine ligase / carboxylate-amine ligase
VGLSVTFGVEEEFFVVEANSLQLAPVAKKVLAAIPADLRPFVKLETRATQIELATPVLTDLATLAPQLDHIRSTLGTTARSLGCRIMAVGACILREDTVFPMAEEDRYGDMANSFGPLEDPHGLCACHVHVGVADRRLAVQVLNHVRTWLPVLQALASNSPFMNGAATGYASSRDMSICAQPTVGPPPWLRSIEHHDALVGELIATGAALDTRMVYWYARLSAVYPTVEVRPGDVCLTVDDTVLVAGLTRALVAKAMNDIAAGISAPPVDDASLVAAHWLSAREGLEGSGFCYASRTRRPMWDLVSQLVTHTERELDRLGDLPLVLDSLDRLRARGSGAARQRAAAGPALDLSSVARWAAEQTVARPMTIHS